MHLFYQPDNALNYLNEEESRHCAKVLRFKQGDVIQVTDGNGLLCSCRLEKVDIRRTTYVVVEKIMIPLPDYRIHMAICPTRIAERNEWMVEKMTELGVHKVQFIVSEHTHKETINRVVNLERLNRIALSAMKQSQQHYLPELTLYATFKEYLDQVTDQQRYIAYVADDEIPEHLMEVSSKNQTVSILIGPEGDFSPTEIQIGMEYGFVPISLGPTRLRTETAAVIACHSINLVQILP
jgi:16S rRNA (uracil1498-N3)-methyltransferase